MGRRFAIPPFAPSLTMRLLISLAILLHLNSSFVTRSANAHTIRLKKSRRYEKHQKRLAGRLLLFAGIAKSCEVGFSESGFSQIPGFQKTDFANVAVSLERRTFY